MDTRASLSRSFLDTAPPPDTPVLKAIDYPYLSRLFTDTDIHVRDTEFDRIVSDWSASNWKANNTDMNGTRTTATIKIVFDKWSTFKWMIDFLDNRASCGIDNNKLRTQKS